MIGKVGVAVEEGTAVKEDGNEVGTIVGSCEGVELGRSEGDTVGFFDPEFGENVGD